MDKPFSIRDFEGRGYRPRIDTGSTAFLIFTALVIALPILAFWGFAVYGIYRFIAG